MDGDQVGVEENQSYGKKLSVFTFDHPKYFDTFSYPGGIKIHPGAEHGP
jgi:hypothetical protein